MEFWNNALRVGGPVAIVAFVLWVLIRFIYQEHVLRIFGAEYVFVISILLVAGLLVCLLAAILTYSGSKKKPGPSAGNSATFKKSTVHGDAVIGDKNLNSKD